MINTKPMCRNASLSVSLFVSLSLSLSYVHVRNSVYFLSLLLLLLSPARAEAGASHTIAAGSPLLLFSLWREIKKTEDPLRHLSLAAGAQGSRSRTKYAALLEQDSVSYRAGMVRHVLLALQREQLDDPRGVSGDTALLPQTGSCRVPADSTSAWRARGRAGAERWCWHRALKKWRRRARRAPPDSWLSR